MGRDDDHIESLLVMCTNGLMTHILIYLQVDGTGNCLFSALKKSMAVRNAASREATYFPNRYFRRMVVSYMVNNRQLIMKNKFVALMSTYSVVVEGDQGRGWTTPLSFRQYLHLLLRRDFWGDEIVLFAVSCMWLVKITGFNTKTMQEYRIRHDRAMEDADMVVTYNGSNHFNAAGKEVWFSFVDRHDDPLLLPTKIQTRVLMTHNIIYPIVIELAT